MGKNNPLSPTVLCFKCFSEDIKNKSNSKNDKNTIQWISNTKLNSINKNISPVKDKYPLLNS